MSLALRFCLILTLAISSCKKSDGGSNLAAWELEGNRQAAQEFIVNTVNQIFQDTKGQQAPLQEFALALADQKTDQTESAGYVLQTYYDQSKEGSLEGEASPIQQYIIQQFVIMTNYIAYHNDPKANPLKYLGTPN